MSREILKDSVAIITGAGQGLGRTVAAEFAEEGCAVAIVDINRQALGEVETELRETGHTVKGYVLDITDHKTYGEAIDDVAKKWGHIDILVNNAAISLSGTILDDSLENWRRQTSVNLEAVYMGTKMVVPYMVQQKSGRIINIASIQGFLSSGQCGAYNAAKGGMIAFTKSLAVELAPYNIAVNAVAPGFMRTPMALINGVQESEMPDFQKWYVEKRHIPMARTGYPEDISGTVVFLASDYCRYMTGALLVVDGGLSSTF
jgi:NAD(P)-dependent dehydrogenase (short-subunit alcohol dehydrogenase family)